MDAIERTVVIPAAEVIVHRAARRQILWQRSPLTAGAQDIHQPVDDLTHVYGPLVAATLGWRNNQTDQRPFGISEVAGIAQRAAVIPSAVVVRPHRAGSCESGRTERITTDSHDSRCSQMDTKNREPISLRYMRPRVMTILPDRHPWTIRTVQSAQCGDGRIDRRREIARARPG